MKVKITANQLICHKTTDVSDSKFMGLGSNDRDEVYFTVAGASSRGKIAIPRIAPNSSSDYYGLKAGNSTGNIVLWEGELSDGEEVSLTVLIREQDNAQLAAIQDAVQGVALVIAGYFTDQDTLTSKGLKKLEESGKGLLASLSKDGDQTIGGFTVRARVQKGIFLDWSAISNAQTTLISKKGLSASFQAQGAKSKYTLNVGVPPHHIHFLGIFTAGNDNYSFYSSNYNNFISTWKKSSNQGLRLIDFDSHFFNGSRDYVGVMRGGNDRYHLYVGLPWDSFAAKYFELAKQGQRLTKISSELQGGKPRFNGIFRAGSFSHLLYAGDWQLFTRKWEESSQNGYRLVSMTTYKIGNQARQYVGIFHAGTGAHAFYSLPWERFWQKYEELNRKGLRLIDISTHDERGQIICTGVFRAGKGIYNVYNGDWNQFVEFWNKSSNQGLRLTSVATQASYQEPLKVPTKQLLLNFEKIEKFKNVKFKSTPVKKIGKIENFKSIPVKKIRTS